MNTNETLPSSETLSSIISEVEEKLAEIPEAPDCLVAKVLRLQNALHMQNDSFSCHLKNLEGVMFSKTEALEKDLKILTECFARLENLVQVGFLKILGPNAIKGDRE
jgi:hypothetical protein